MKGMLTLAENKRYIPRKEFVTYAVGALGQGMVYGIMSSYISDFYMNVLMVPAVFVLLLMLLARIWDAINDPIMGVFVDHHRYKSGKMRPYLLITPIPIAILTVMLFTAPDISNTAKMVYAAITYTFWGMIYTMSDVPFWSMPNAMTPDPAERGKLISVSRTANGVGSAVPMALFMAVGPLLALTGLEGVELEKRKYTIVVLIASLIGNLLFVRVYKSAKERVNIPEPKKRAKGEPSSLKVVFKCKPLMLVALMGILSSGRYMYQAAGIHVARYTFYVGGDLAGLSSSEVQLQLQSSISTVSLIFSVGSAVGMFGTMLLIPKLIEKFSYKSLLIGSCVIGAASSIIMYFVGYDNVFLCIPFLIISCIPCGVINTVAYAMIGDALDYMEYKTGRRENGLGNACQSFVLKLGNALATSAIILMYIVVGLDPATVNTGSAGVNVLMLEHSVRNGMFMLVTIIPTVSLLLCIIPILFYDLTGEKKEEITKALAEQREQRGISVE